MEITHSDQLPSRAAATAVRCDVKFFAELRRRLTGHERQTQALLPRHFNTAFLNKSIRALEPRRVETEPLAARDA